MRAGEHFRLDSSWWKRSRAATLLPTGLGKALVRYEATRRNVLDIDKESHPLDACDVFDACVAALAAVDKARVAAIARCTHPPHKETKDALKRDAAIGDARGELAERCLVPIQERLQVLDAQLETLGSCKGSLEAELRKIEGREPSAQEAAAIRAVFGRLERLTEAMSTNLASLPNAARLSRIDAKAGRRRTELEQNYKLQQSATIKAAAAPYLSNRDDS